MVRSPSGVTRMKERAVAGPSVAGLEFKAHALGPHVMGVDAAQLIGLHLAEIGGLAAEGGHTRRGISRRAAGDFNGRPHAGIERFGARLIDQVHRAFDQAIILHKGVIHLGNHIDNGIANCQNINPSLHDTISRIQHRP